MPRRNVCDARGRFEEYRSFCFFYREQSRCALSSSLFFHQVPDIRKHRVGPTCSEIPQNHMVHVLVDVCVMVVLINMAHFLIQPLRP